MPLPPANVSVPQVSPPSSPLSDATVVGVSLGFEYHHCCSRFEYMYPGTANQVALQVNHDSVACMTSSAT